MAKFYGVSRDDDGKFIAHTVSPGIHIQEKLTEEHPVSICKYASDNSLVFVVLATNQFDAIDKVEYLTKRFAR